MTSYWGAVLLLSNWCPSEVRQTCCDMMVSEETEVRGVDRELTTTGRTRRDIFDGSQNSSESFYVVLDRLCATPICLFSFVPQQTQQIKQSIDRSIGQSIDQSHFNCQAPVHKIIVKTVKSGKGRKLRELQRRDPSL